MDDINRKGSELTDVDADAPVTSPARPWKLHLLSHLSLRGCFVQRSSLHWPSLLKPPPARTSEDMFAVVVFMRLSLHHFEHATTMLLACLQTQSLALINPCQSFVDTVPYLRSELSYFHVL